MIGALYRRVCERLWNRDSRRHTSEMRRLEQTAQAREVDHLDALALQLAQIRSLPRVHTSGRARALDAWRDAAQLVSTRWEDFRQAGSGTREVGVRVLRRRSRCGRGHGRGNGPDSWSRNGIGRTRHVHCAGPLRWRWSRRVPRRNA
jgi:hypothetical protein